MINKIRIIIIALGCFFGITLFFINSSIMTNFLGRYLHVDYSYTGGIVAGDFIDFSKNGDGAEILRYTVHQPVTNARWQNSADYWQLDFELKNNLAAQENILIYISLDNIDGGSTQSLFENAGNISFDEKHPWIFAVWVKGDKGTVYNSKGEALYETENCFLNDGKLLKLRIPLKNKELLKILGAEKSYHYVVTGDFSEEKTKISPVEVQMTGAVNIEKNIEDDKAYIQRVKELYIQSGALKNMSGDLEANLSAYKAKIDENPEDYESLAYYGSLLAMKGGQSNVMKAVALVNESYTYLDKAAELANGKEGEIEVLMNRASVSASVPDQVFGKAESGAKDFMKIISLTDDKMLKAYCYVMAYECYTNCGKDSQAFLALQEAKKMIE